MIINIYNLNENMEYIFHLLSSRIIFFLHTLPKHFFMVALKTLEICLPNSNIFKFFLNISLLDVHDSNFL